jgi:hypothetical protein
MEQSATVGVRCSQVVQGDNGRRLPFGRERTTLAAGTGAHVLARRRLAARRREVALRRLCDCAEVVRARYSFREKRLSGHGCVALPLG